MLVVTNILHNAAQLLGKIQEKPEKSAAVLTMWREKQPATATQLH
jgi:hypothetical protein